MPHNSLTARLVLATNHITTKLQKRRSFLCDAINASKNDLRQSVHCTTSEQACYPDQCDLWTRAWEKSTGNQSFWLCDKQRKTLARKKFLRIISVRTQARQVNFASLFSVSKPHTFTTYFCRAPSVASSWAPSSDKDWTLLDSEPRSSDSCWKKLASWSRNMTSVSMGDGTEWAPCRVP